MDRTVQAEDVIKVVAPLDPILADDSVWEIMVDRYDRVLVDRGGPVEEVESPFASPEELRALIDGLFGLYGIQLDATNPVGYLRLPDHSRVMAVLPPNAVNGPYLVLRRIVGRHLTWDNLIGWGSVSQEAYELIQSAVKARVSMLVSGGTGSGKTTLASLIAELSPPEERVIVVEQAYGMAIDHPRTVRLEAGGPSGLTFEDALTAAQRMRADRLIVGEISGPIAPAVLHLFGTGYDGSLTTIHGTSVEDTLSRLESFCLMADLGLGLAEIRQMIAAGIKLIVQQERLADGTRKVVEIVELRGIENLRYVLQPLGRYDLEASKFVCTGATPSWTQ